MVACIYADFRQFSEFSAILDSCLHACYVGLHAYMSCWHHRPQSTCLETLIYLLRDLYLLAESLSQICICLVAPKDLDLLAKIRKFIFHVVVAKLWPAWKYFLIAFFWAARG